MQNNSPDLQQVFLSPKCERGAQISLNASSAQNISDTFERISFRKRQNANYLDFLLILRNTNMSPIATEMHYGIHCSRSLDLPNREARCTDGDGFNNSTCLKLAKNLRHKLRWVRSPLWKLLLRSAQSVLNPSHLQLSSEPASNTQSRVKAVLTQQDSPHVPSLAVPTHSALTECSTVCCVGILILLACHQQILQVFKIKAVLL